MDEFQNKYLILLPFGQLIEYTGTQSQVSKHYFACVKIEIDF